jgi:hypothetical protein
MVADHQGGEHQGGMSVALPVFGRRGRMKLPHRRKFLHLAAAAVALPFAPHLARAQAYPTVRIIGGFAAGAGTDIVARLIGQ